MPIEYRYFTIWRCVNTELGQASSLVHARSQRHNLKTPTSKTVGLCGYRINYGLLLNAISMACFVFFLKIFPHY